MKLINDKILDKKYFIFDIDGTLVDSMEMWNTIDQVAIFNLSGKMVDPEELKVFRDSVLYSDQNLDRDVYELLYEEIVKHYSLNMSVEDYKKARNAYVENYSINFMNFKSGAANFLNMIKEMGKKIGIATATTKEQIDIYSKLNKGMKKQISINQVADIIVACEDVKRKKPDPEVYLKTMELFGAKKDECIVFEDSLSGVMAAKDAGLETVVIYDESAKEDQHYLEIFADYKIQSFDEIIKYLQLEQRLSKMQ